MSLRPQKREQEKISTYLTQITKEYLDFRFSLPQENQANDSMDMEMKFIELNNKWKTFCKKKFKYGVAAKPSAFLKNIAKMQLIIMEKEISAKELLKELENGELESTETKEL